MSVVEGKHCRYWYPDDWQPFPPDGAVPPEGDEEGARVYLVEQWLDEPQQLDQITTARRTVLETLLDEFHLVEDREREAPVGGADYRVLDYQYLDEDGDPFRECRHFVQMGTFLAELTTRWPTDAPKGEVDVLQGIPSTFRLADEKFFGKPKKLELFLVPPEDAGQDEVEGEVEGEGSEPQVSESQSSESQGLMASPSSAASAEDPVAPELPTVAAPICTVRQGHQSEWTARVEESGEVRLTHRGSEVTLRRLIGVDRDTSSWMNQRMIDLQESGSVILGSTAGRLPDGQSYVAVLSHEAGQGQRWRTAATRHTLDLLVEDRHSLWFQGQANPDGVERLQRELEQLATSYDFLPSEEWRTPVAEDWLDLTLEGAWQCEGPGVYINLEEGTFLHLSTAPANTTVDAAAEELAKSLRGGSGFDEIEREVTDLVDFRGWRLFRMELDGRTEEGPVSLRAAWLGGEEEWRVVLVRGNVGQVDSLIQRLLENMKASGLSL